jgi:hypothetical protein
MPKKPTDTLTWKKDDKYATIDKILHETTTIDKNTGKEIYTLKELSKIPPITRTRRHKRKKHK